MPEDHSTQLKSTSKNVLGERLLLHHMGCKHQTRGQLNRPYTIIHTSFVLSSGKLGPSSGRWFAMARIGCARYRPLQRNSMAPFTIWQPDIRSRDLRVVTLSALCTALDIQAPLTNFQSACNCLALANWFCVN